MTIYNSCRLGGFLIRAPRYTSLQLDWFLYKKSCSRLKKNTSFRRLQSITFPHVQAVC